MTDSGLSARLRQQSRRAGLMVGMTMVLAIAICIFGAAGLYAALSRPFSDLIPMVAPVTDVPTSPAESEAANPAPTNEPIAIASTEEPAVEPAQPTVAPTAEAFEPTHEVTAFTSVNFRTGPSVGDSVIIALSPAAPLQYLDEEVTAADGENWMRFRNEDGEEGWILESLVGPYSS